MPFIKQLFSLRIMLAFQLLCESNSQFVIRTFNVIKVKDEIYFICKIESWSTTIAHHSLPAGSAGNEVESLLLVVELGLGVVDWSWSRCRANKVKLSLGVVGRSRANRRGDEGELSVLVSLPLRGPFNLHLSLASPSSAGYKVQSVGRVNQVRLLPLEELLGVVDPLGGGGSNAGGEVGQLGGLVSLPLGTANYLDLGRGQGQESQWDLAQWWRDNPGIYINIELTILENMIQILMGRLPLLMSGSDWRSTKSLITHNYPLTRSDLGPTQNTEVVLVRLVMVVSGIPPTHHKSNNPSQGPRPYTWQYDIVIDLWHWFDWTAYNKFSGLTGLLASKPLWSFVFKNL